MIDIIVCLILLVFGLIGYKKGLVRSALTLVSSVASLLVAFIGYPIIKAILKVTPICTMIYEGILDKVSGIDFGVGVQSQANAILEKVNWVPQVITEQIKNNNNAAMYEFLGVENLHQYIAMYLTNLVLGLLAIIIGWFIIRVVMASILKILSGIVEHLPVISSFNRGGGLLLGILKGVLTLSIIGLIMPLFASYPSFQELYQSIEASYITKWLYENNFILLIYNYFVLAK